MPPTAEIPGQRFELLYRISQTFNSSLDLSEVFSRVIDEVIAATGAERGFVITLAPDGTLVFQAARGLAQQALDPATQIISRSVIDQAIAAAEPVLSQDAESDTRFNDQQSVLDLKLKSILCVPFKCRGGLRGVIYVENRIQRGLFGQRQVELLAAIAANASIAIDNAQYFSELQEQLKTIRLLYEINADLTSRLDLDQVLAATLQRVRQALSTPAASLLMVEGDELVFKIALGEQSAEIKPFRVPLEGSIAGWVVQNRQGVIINDVRQDARFYQQADQRSGFHTQSVMAAPLLIQDQAFGVIELFNKPGGFSQGDLELLASIAASAAIAIENARLYQAAVEKGRMERELQMALSVQTSLLPRRLPELTGWDFAVQWRPARELSGDFYDFIHLDGASHTLFGGAPQLGIAIADVTDKGMPAALFMAFTRSIVRAYLSQVVSPAEGLSLANGLICEESHRGLFVTLFYGQLNPLTGDLTYVNAGHNPPLHYRAAAGALARLMPTGIPLGIVDDFTYKQEQITLQPGDFVLCYTDGVTEAVDPGQQQFRLERLESLALEHAGDPAAALASAVDQAVTAFSDANQPFDDTTILVVRRL